MYAKNLYFVGIQSTYQVVEFVLYNNNFPLEMRSIKKVDASATLVPSLSELLKTHDLMVNNLSFIAVNQGPAPFTTLRVVIASVNGISFETDIVLIGIDGLEALLEEHFNFHLLPTVALLDAFSNDVYYGVQAENKSILKGCRPISVFLQELDNLYPMKQIRFLGNGVSLHEKEIRTIFGKRAILQEPVVATCSVKQVAQMGLQRWHASRGLSNYVLPIYLKKQWLQTKNI
ncbi:tRNA (adenosine(37)-N6)-threonylcarbamoyltransferase complex dimerization subunit type 1 TsaB [Candidatus Dependentiae bacterium]|nr:MAG: tRNA (adenosine(37)-N6)-threonylcarbamoyltransferase complex dimerization subunit type 1 TsaB [Candidatus Dependentiae bacterium]